MTTLLIMLNLMIMTNLNQQKAPFEIAKLPYANDALAPYISEETVDYHYGKHYQGYVNNLNKLIAGTEFEKLTIEEIMLRSTGPLFNNAAQAWNHGFYFLTFSPHAKHRPEGKLAQAIDRHFGSFDEFIEKFNNLAGSLFGSGWTWLALDKEGNLEILNTPNGVNPLVEGKKPLLGIDVWEHAYYIDYRNARADHLKAIWNIVDWRVVEERFEK